MPILHSSRISAFAPWFRSVTNMNDLSYGYLYLSVSIFKIPITEFKNLMKQTEKVLQS